MQSWQEVSEVVFENCWDYLYKTGNLLCVRRPMLRRRRRSSSGDPSLFPPQFGEYFVKALNGYDRTCEPHIYRVLSQC